MNRNNSFQPCLNESIIDTSCKNAIGVISKIPIEKCADGIINISYDSTNEVLDIIPRDTVIFFFYIDSNNAWGSKMGFLNSKTFIRQSWMNFGITYYVGARLGRANGKGDIDTLLGCIKESLGTPFTFFEIPRPSAGEDISVCGKEFDMQGTQSLTKSKIKWSEKNNKAVIFYNTNDANTQIDVLDGYGIYCFILEEDNGNGLCVVSDEVCITFNSNPEIVNLDKVCFPSRRIDSMGEKYIACAEIQGGLAPYTLVIPPSTSNGKINGNTYCTDSIESLSDFIVLVRDANGCESSLLQDNYNCNCGAIFAGQLDTNITIVCQNICVPIKSLIKETLQPNEIAMYILHKSSYNSPIDVIDTFYSINDVICFDPKTMKLGGFNPVYITRVVGDDVAPKDGIVDPNDPCKRASNNMKIVFEQYATPLAGQDEQVCGLNYTLDGQLTFGTASWKLITGPGTVTFVDGTDPTSGLTVSVKGTYTFELEGDNFGCIGKDSVQITFVDAPQFVKKSLLFECDKEEKKYRLIINIILGDRSTSQIVASYNKGQKNLNGNFIGTSDTWLSDWFPSRNDFTLSVSDINKCNTNTMSGRHFCTYITKPDTISTTYLSFLKSSPTEEILPLKNKSKEKVDFNFGELENKETHL
ncbi:MAG: hypothetical protein ABIO44_06115, partial [Saprospiraceae bacterium]